MRVLVVEDHSFNAYCLQRLLETSVPHIKVSIVNNSLAAMTHLQKDRPDLIILDGHLGVSDGLHCNGPILADTIWKNYPQMRIISWTDSESMRQAFAAVYKQHGKSFNVYSSWSKVVNPERIRKSLAYVNGHFSQMPSKCETADAFRFRSA